MNLHQLSLTRNSCYVSGKKHTPRGIMVHSTGANNPKLSRYVGPDDGLLGTTHIITTGTPRHQKGAEKFVSMLSSAS